MSGGQVCTCPESKKPIERRGWVIVDYKCNYSKFSGSKWTRSDYSQIECRCCMARWRTKAGYVDHLKVAT